MAEIFVGPVVEAVLSKLISITTEQINLALGFKKELTKLGHTVRMIQAFLQDAEERGTNNHSVKVWLQRLNDVAYEADDLLDEFSYEILRRKVEIRDQIGRRVLNFFSSSNSIAFRLKMAEKIKDIFDSLDDLNKLATQLGLQHTDHASHVFRRSNVETISFLDDSEIVGRKTDVSKVVDLLVNPKDDRLVSVVPIVGIGGLGKTTLAKLIYNDLKVQSHFDVKFWVCVSDHFDVNRILKEMLGYFTNDQQTSMPQNRDAMIKTLKEKLEGRAEHIKYLLVLDDVWNFEKWEELKLCLTGISKNAGNGVIATTRNQDVASAMKARSDQSYQPRILGDEECWSIIKARVSESSLMSQELELIGLQIAEQCRGVPLVARVIAGTLCSIEMSPGEWLKIQKSDVWGSERSVLSVLKLSFDHLSSPSLKKCFAYCAMFPKDYWFEKVQLIQLWFAQGYLGSSTQMVNVGDRYFNELLSHSLFQDVEKYTCRNIDKYFNELLSHSLFQDVEKYTRRNIVTCKMHDLVHDLALSVSKFDTLIIREDFTNTTNDHCHHVRHLNVGYDGECLPGILTAVAPKLRSLFSEVDVFKNQSRTFTSLRTLKFSGDKHTLEFPAFLGELKHLRYFEISETCIRAVPRPINKLYHLQTLRLVGSFINSKSLPSLGQLHNLQFLELAKMEKVKRMGNGFYCNGSSSSNSKNKMIGVFPALKKLSLEYMENLEEWTIMEGTPMFISLEELRVSYCYRLRSVPLMGPRLSFEKLWKLRIERCSSLSTLPNLEGLSSLRNLYVYGCSKLEVVPIEGRCSSLEKLCISRCEELRKIGDGLSSTATCLKKMKLEHCPNLSSIPVLKGFSCLQNLCIDNCEKLEIVPIEGRCSSLEKLSISNCEELRKIGDGFSTATCLKELRLSNCDNLSSIPDLEGFSSLQNISIHYCLKLEVVCLEGRCSSLEILDVTYCYNLRTIGEGYSTSTCLKEIHLYRCDNLRSIPDLEGFSLEILDVTYCYKLERISLKGPLSSLKQLRIQNCGNLKLILGIDGVSSLTELGITGVGEEWSCLLPSLLSSNTSLCKLAIGGNFWEELEEFPGLNSIEHLSASLRVLQLTGWKKLKSLPHQIQFLTTLEELEIDRFDGIEALPEWLGNLSSLRSLYIWRCDNIMYLPSVDVMQSLSNLKEIWISGCPQLTTRCAGVDGSEWSKISHISNIRIDHEWC